VIIGILASRSFRAGERRAGAGPDQATPEPCNASHPRAVFCNATRLQQLFISSPLEGAAAFARKFG
jgi:hypothetical protein